MPKTIRFALYDTLLYYFGVLIIVITLVMNRTSEDSKYLSAEAGLVDAGLIMHLLTYGLVLYGLKVFLISLIYRSDTAMDYRFKGTPLRYVFIVFYLGTLGCFLYADWISLQVVYTTLSAENTVQGLVTWVALLMIIAFFVVSSIIAAVLHIINDAMRKRRLTRV